MSNEEFDNTFKGLSDFIADKDILEWYKDLIKGCMEEEAGEFARWMNENNYKSATNGSWYSGGQWEIKQYYTIQELYKLFKEK
jgi:3-dehydroquinate dehydratase